MGYWGSPDPQIFVRKVLSMAGIQSAVWAASLSATLTWSKQSEGAGSRERCPQPRLTPPHHTHLLWSSVSPCRQPGTARTPSGYIQKWVVQRDLRGRVRAAGKPSDEPLCKGKTQSPTVSLSARTPAPRSGARYFTWSVSTQFSAQVSRSSPTPDTAVRTSLSPRLVSRVARGISPGCKTVL